MQSEKLWKRLSLTLPAPALLHCRFTGVVVGGFTTCFAQECLKPTIVHSSLCSSVTAAIYFLLSFCCNFSWIILNIHSLSVDKSLALHFECIHFMSLIFFWWKNSGFCHTYLHPNKYTGCWKRNDCTESLLNSYLFSLLDCIRTN